MHFTSAMDYVLDAQESVDTSLDQCWHRFGSLLLLLLVIGER